MKRNLIVAVSAAAAMAFSFFPNATLAMTAQEFLAAEARGEFNSKSQQRARHAQQPRQTQRQTERQTERQNRFSIPPQRQQASVTRMSPIGGLNMGGSWLASNIGASRPSGAPGAWCGYAMRMEMVSQGHGDPGPSFNLVSRWCSVGTPAPVGAIGSIFVSRGHVSKVVAGNCPPGRVATISGNATGRRVSHMCEPISRAVCSRWPGKVNS